MYPYYTPYETEQQIDPNDQRFLFFPLLFAAGLAGAAWGGGWGWGWGRPRPCCYPYGGYYPYGYGYGYGYPYATPYGYY
ncbi:MAG: hypothetical protein ACI35O_05845 [Bacillaceae bacterium]